MTKVAPTGLAERVRRTEVGDIVERHRADAGPGLVTEHAKPLVAG